MSGLSTSRFLLVEIGHLVYPYPTANLVEILNKYLPEVPKFVNLSSRTFYPIKIIVPGESSTKVTEKGVQKFISENPPQNSEQFKLIDLGYGLDYKDVASKSESDCGIDYVIVHYPYGDRIRKFFKLEPIHFYIDLSLGREFKYTCRTLQDSSIKCSSANPTAFLIDNPSPIQSKQIELLEWTLQNYPKTKKLILELCTYYSETDENYDKILELCDMVLDLNDVAGFYMKIKTLKAMGESASAILGRIFTSLSKFEIPTTLDLEQQTYVKFILKFLNEETNEGQWKYYFYEVKVLTRNIVRYQMPHNFGWVRPKLTAGTSIPHSDDLDIFEKMGVKNVISCFERPLFPENYSSNLQVHFFEIEDFTSPTFKQMDGMLAILAKGEPTVVHCLGGAGRTNTVLVCDLIRTQNLNAEQAIAKINQVRPLVILEDCQVKFIHEFSDKHFKKSEQLPGRNFFNKIFRQ